MEAGKKDQQAKPDNAQADNGRSEQSTAGRRPDGAETRRWVDSLEYVLEYVLKDRESDHAPFLLDRLLTRLRESGLNISPMVNTTYINTIAPEQEPPYPGNREIERRIKSYIRWNAMAMVVKANRIHHGIGGHISTYASCATLYEVGFNHFFNGGDGERPPDTVYFQGHASPGNYARAYLERRLDAKHLHHFRQELAPGGGLPSYPHPYLLSDFW